MKHICRVMSVLAAVALCTSAEAQWTVEVLNPSGSTRTLATDSAPGQLVGLFETPTRHACVWQGSPPVFIDLTPNGFHSLAYGTDGTTQVGDVGSVSYSRAAKWNGSAASLVELHPQNAVESSARAVDGDIQGGFVKWATDIHACLWRGTAASIVDLNPAGATVSIVNDVHEDRQFGWAHINSENHPGIWRGTAASFVSLRPLGVTAGVYRLHATDGVEQVGHTYSNQKGHAVLWKGTAESYLDLHPPGHTESYAEDVIDGVQVGHARDGFWQAGYWTGTPESWVSLHGYLPSRFSSSHARSAHREGDQLIVAGFATDSTTGNEEAVRWTGPMPIICYPDCDQSTGLGVLDVFDFLCFQNSFVSGELYACDCDTSTGQGVCDVFDFLCFQDAFVSRCP